MTTIGRKDDLGKRRFSLLPWDAVTSVVDVLMFGAAKYGAGNWRHVNNGEERYLDAALRHITSHLQGEVVDEESGLPHLAHAGCSVLFALSLVLSKEGT